MIICPHCKKDFKLTFPKRTYEQRVRYRYSPAWKHGKDILEKYKNGDTIMGLAREYKADKRIIRNVLRENGVEKFRGRKGIQAWNKGKRHPKVSGEKHHSWKNGITPLMVRIRRCARYKWWVKDILLRDNYTCLICKKMGGDKEVDHFPKMFCDIISDNKITTFEDAINCQELWNLENGRTLCRGCHQKVPKIKGKNQVSRLK